MRTPTELIEKLDGALENALTALAAHPWTERVAIIARLVSEPDPGKRTVGAIHLSTGLLHAREFDDASEERRDAIERYESVIAPAIRAALDMVAYDEFEDFALTNPNDPHVRYLPREALSRMRGSVLRSMGQRYSRTLEARVGAHTLTFLVHGSGRGQGSLLVVDGAHALDRVEPRVGPVTAGSRYLLVTRVGVRGEPASRGPHGPQPPTHEVVVDLEEHRFSEYDDRRQRFADHEVAICAIDDLAVQISTPSGLIRRVALGALGYVELSSRSDFD